MKNRQMTEKLDTAVEHGEGYLKIGDEDIPISSAIERYAPAVKSSGVFEAVILLGVFILTLSAMIAVLGMFFELIPGVNLMLGGMLIAGIFVFAVGLSIAGRSPFRPGLGFMLFGKKKF